MTNILLSIVSICTFLSYFPQTIKLIETKKAEDLSLPFWLLWFLSSLAYTLYAIFLNKDYMLMFESGLELFFSLLILSLTLKYKK